MVQLPANRHAHELTVSTWLLKLVGSWRLDIHSEYCLFTRKNSTEKSERVENLRKCLKNPEKSKNGRANSCESTLDPSQRELDDLSDGGSKRN
jgi:hypothetical protein